MLAIRMRFLSGRFHATPWGHHVNEGVVEYPPSLWRLLRSLVATFYRAFADRAHDEGTNEAVVWLKEILAKLSAPPEFYLPHASVAHTRHYDQQNNGMKFFDTFLCLNPRDELVWVWRDVVLDQEELQFLRELLNAMGTFGRAESWCEAEPLSEEETDRFLGPSDSLLNSKPVNEMTVLRDAETMRVLLPQTEPTANELFENLKISTSTMKEQKYLEPEGSRWVTYARPANILQPRLNRPAGPRQERQYTVARYALSASVLPLVTAALPFAEMSRAALSRCRAGNSYSPALTGKTSDGIPLSGHEHAHFFATDEDNDGRLDHLTIYAPCGFNPDDVEALGQFQVIHRYGDRASVRTVLLGLGNKEDFVHVPVFKLSRRWKSVTPFSLPRFPNRGGGKPPRPRDRPEGQVSRELTNRGLPTPISIRRTNGYRAAGRRETRWLEFHARRIRKQAGGYGLAGFEIEFADPVRGPICLGFGCHFSLGLFLPD
jgi:CRISPR-associated protein Csb2